MVIVFTLPLTSHAMLMGFQDGMGLWDETGKQQYTCFSDTPQTCIGLDDKIYAKSDLIAGNFTPAVIPSPTPVQIQPTPTPTSPIVAGNEPAPIVTPTSSPTPIQNPVIDSVTLDSSSPASKTIGSNVESEIIGVYNLHILNTIGGKSVNINEVTFSSTPGISFIQLEGTQAPVVNGTATITGLTMSAGNGTVLSARAYFSGAVSSSLPVQITLTKIKYSYQSNQFFTGSVPSNIFTITPF